MKSSVNGNKTFTGRAEVQDHWHMAVKSKTNAARLAMQTGSHVTVDHCWNYF